MKSSHIVSTAWQHGGRLRQWLAAELFDNEGLDTLFQHVRNVLSASLVIAAGLYATHHQPLWPALALWTVQAAGGVITILGVVLLLLNVVDGLRRLSSRGYPLVLHLVAAAVYLGLTMRLVQVVAYFRNVT